MKSAICDIRCVLIFLLIACLLLPASLLAQESKGQHNIYLKNGTLKPSGNVRLWLDSMQGAVVKEPVLALVHFNFLPTVEQRTILERNGITLMEYVPDNTFTAIIRPPLNTDVVLSLPVHSIINIAPEWKAGDYLWKKVSSEGGVIEVLVSFYQNIDANAVKQFISRIGGQVRPGHIERYGSYNVVVAANKVHTIAQWYGVRYISPVTEIIPLDIQSRAAVKGNISSATAMYGGYGLLGDSVTVGVGDNTSGIYHTDTRDRAINFNPALMVHHGVFTNGVVGGAANVDPLSISLTPHVTLVDHYFDLILPATGAMYHDYNMTITNNSYTLVEGDCNYAGTYDAYSAFLDTLAIQYPYVQHVFAAGNDGGITCSPYLPGFATVGGGYQPSKNIIVVGSIFDDYFNAYDESRGPVKDGRLIPEIVAIGASVYADIDFDVYEWSGGTSMSSPQVVSGLVALTQRYKQLNGGTQPRADLLKTIILNGAMDLGNPGPDYTYGFGVMDMYRSLQILDNGHYLSNTIANGDSQFFTVNVPTNTGQLKVMLYWNDAPASPSASKQLVNDLDLTVTDPSLAVHLPLVLDPAPANVNNIAMEQADHLNNVEQVTITNPAAGAYTIKARGFSIPAGPQQYVVAYDIIPDGLHLTYPTGGEQVSNADSFRIYWDAVSNGNTFTILFSPDNGVNWTTLSNNIPADIRRWGWLPAGINSGKCLVRIIRNGSGEFATSQRFSVNTQPVVRYDTAQSAQCPGYININWSPVPGAASYYLLRKSGAYMQVVDSATDTAYSFSGMPLNTPSYVSVQPVIDGMAAYRSVAAIGTANIGNCANPVSSGDLMIEKIISPASGRMYTSSQLGAAAVMQVQIRDLYTAACNNYSLSYKINSGAWQILINPGTIPANGNAVISVPGLSLAAPGSYNITVAVHNLGITDPQPSNDTIAFTVLNIPNDTLNLTTPFPDGFETMGNFGVGHDSIGVSPNGHWDYFNTNDTGRMRSFVCDDVIISGNRSISLDENRAVRTGSKNTFVGTFNLSNYDTATAEVRVDFDYILHGTPKSPDGNVVMARGDDVSAWAPFYTYNLNAYPGFVNHVLSLSLTDAVRSGNRNFSTSSEVSFGQNDTSLIATSNYGNGITLDNFRLYTVVNDAALVKIITPLPSDCGLPSSMPLTVQVHNGVNYTLYNVQLFYTMDGSATFTGTIDSIRAKATVNYTFAQQLNTTPGSTHTLNVWLKETGDTYTANDSLLNYRFRNSVIVTSFPYLENFEAGDGGYYSDGYNNSWQYGTPASPLINKAASGVKAWKTNLTGNYNNLEKSYLYSPCFDISQLANPMLSFSAAMDIENCGNTLCDEGYIEYTFDGVTWAKLGIAGQGTNWYDSTFNVWNTIGFTRWHVASIPLPQPPAGQTIHFRFVMSADPGATYEGIAVDDIHIFDHTYPIFSANGAVTVIHDVNGNQWTDYLQASQLLSSVQPNNQNISNTVVTLYAHDTVSNPAATQYIFPRSYTVKASQSFADSAGIRLYLLDSDVVQMLNDNTCPSCTRIVDAYRLGITQYDNRNNTNAENGTLADDTGGVFTYYPYRSVRWAPYDKGYYAELMVKPFSEFWFNDGGPTGTFPAGVDYLNFVAFRYSQGVRTYWYSLIDTAVNVYTVQWSADSVNFTTALDTAAIHSIPSQYSFNDLANPPNHSVLYYRLKWTMTGKNDIYYSPIRKVGISDSAANLITMDANMINHQSVLVNWTSYIDGMVNHYILERAIGSNAYITIDNTISLKHYGQQYYITDQPTEHIQSGRLLHYRLTAVLEDGSTIVLPIRTVEWDNNGAVINIYPNPTHNNSFTIVWNADAGTTMHINMADAVGRSMYQATAIAAQWNNTTTFQTGNHAKGLYFIRIDIGGSRCTVKIVYE
ncbi:MAG: S8 family serine peptidase [Chitinophagales bacterium]